MEEPIRNPAVDPIMPRVRHDPLARDHPALAGFPHIVDAAELSGRSAQDCPALARLLSRLAAIRDRPAEERIAATIARLTSPPG